MIAGATDRQRNLLAGDALACTIRRTEANMASMTEGEKKGVAIAAAAIAVALQAFYKQRGWKVPVPLWLTVTAGATYVGFHGYKAITVK